MAESSEISNSEMFPKTFYKNTNVRKFGDNKTVNIKFLKSNELQKIKFDPLSNILYIIPKKSEGRDSLNCQKVKKNISKFSCNKKMSNLGENNVEASDQVFNRVSNWVNTHHFQQNDNQNIETTLVDENDGISNISVNKTTERIERNTASIDDGVLVLEERTDVVEERTDAVNGGDDKDDHFIKTLNKFSQYSPFEKKRQRTASPSHFSVIVEGEELVCPYVNVILCIILVLYLILSLYYYEFTIGYLFCPY